MEISDKVRAVLRTVWREHIQDEFGYGWIQENEVSELRALCWSHGLTPEDRAVLADLLGVDP